MNKNDLMLRYLFTDRGGDSCYAIEEEILGAPAMTGTPEETQMVVIGTVRFAPLTSKRTRLLEWKEPETHDILEHPAMQDRKNNLGTL